MLVDLKRFNSLGDIKGVMCFMDTVFSDVCIKEQAARDLCGLRQDIRLNFNAAEGFFVDLGWVKLESGVLSATNDCPYGRDGVDLAFEICHDCIERLVLEGTLDVSEVSYDAENSSYLIPLFAFPIAVALYRNVLLQFGAITETALGYKLDPRYESLLADSVRKVAHRMSLERLKDLQRQQEAQGERGEIYVLRYERRRLNGSPLAERVKRISEIDVSAGYDIVSYADSCSISPDRFIEVKTFSGVPHFFWSSNEMEKARLLGRKYVIALVDDARLDDGEYEPHFIADPYVTLRTAGGWELRPTSYEVNKVDLARDDEFTHEILEDVAEELKYNAWLPIYSLRAACGVFGASELVSPGGWIKADRIGRLDKSLFVVRASGKSMEPLIHDGDYCVMSMADGRKLEGRAVLAEYHSEEDGESSGAYTIKTLRRDENGVALVPRNQDYPVLRPALDKLRIIGEFRCVL